MATCRLAFQDGLPLLTTSPVSHLMGKSSGREGNNNNQKVFQQKHKSATAMQYFVERVWNPADLFFWYLFMISHQCACCMLLAFDNLFYISGHDRDFI